MSADVVWAVVLAPLVLVVALRIARGLTGGGPMASGGGVGSHPRPGVPVVPVGTSQRPRRIEDLPPRPPAYREVVVDVALLPPSIRERPATVAAEVVEDRSPAPYRLAVRPARSVGGPKHKEIQS